MPIRKISFVNNQYFHIYNRGVEKRKIINDNYDIMRFLESINVFNTTESVGGIYNNSFENKKLRRPASKLVEVIAFNILDNHYHFVLKQLTDNGISKFMHALGTGYAKYFNEKNKRSGGLFQGSFKAKHIESDRSLEYVVAYVNLNHLVHKLGKLGSNWGMRSSLEQYIGDVHDYKNKYFKCSLDVIMSNFENKKKYLDDARITVENIVKSREESDNLGLEN